MVPVAQPVPAAAPAAPAAAVNNNVPNASSKAPKELPNGVWLNLVQRYNDIELNGAKREFPEKQVLGAEAILARLYHEHTVSKAYTPLYLGEIVSHRSFTALNELNKVAKDMPKKAKMQMDDTGAFTVADPDPWDPKSLMMILDSVEACQWALILVQWGDENAVTLYCQWYARLVRTHANRLEQVKAFWEAAMWRLVLDLRRGITWTQATNSIMLDTAFLQDCLNKTIKKPSGTPDSPNKTRRGGMNTRTPAQTHSSSSTQWSPRGKGNKSSGDNWTSSKGEQGTRPKGKSKGKGKNKSSKGKNKGSDKGTSKGSRDSWTPDSNQWQNSSKRTWEDKSSDAQWRNDDSWKSGSW